MNKYCSLDDAKRATDLFMDFYETVIYKNRFFSKHKIFDELSIIAKKSEFTISSNMLLYRARIYNDIETLTNLYCIEDDIENGTNIAKSVLKDYDNVLAEYNKRKISGFWGYDEEGSFVPPKNAFSEGRTNPVYINYLYAAEEEYTALVEIRPTLESEVCIATIEINSHLRIADFSQNPRGSDSYEDELKKMISSCFSWIVDNKKDYIPSQIISEFIKSLGYDGIRYTSSLYRNGHNVVVFNYEKCKPVSSKIFTVRGIYIRANSTLPYDGSKITHPRLEESN